MRIFSVGSVNVDIVYQVDHFVRPGESMTVRAMQKFPGGKGLNQSVALGKAGASVVQGGIMNGEDTWLGEVLSQANVDISRMKTTAVPTGHAVIQVNKEGQNCILYYPGANHCFDQPYLEQVLQDAQPGDILLLQNEINCLEELFTLACERNLRIAFNPSPFTASIMELPLEYATWLICNEVEGLELTGQSEPEAILDALLQRYPTTNVVLTLGKQGAYYASAKKRFFQKAQRVEAVDTTAAGDTFTGYFLAMTARGEMPEVAMRIATAAAAIAVTRKGAAVSIPLLSEVE